MFRTAIYFFVLNRENIFSLWPFIVDDYNVEF